MSALDEPDPLCSRCGLALPDQATAKLECPKPPDQYEKYIARRKADPAFAARNAPVGHTTSVADHFLLIAREQLRAQGPVVAGLIASAAEAEESLSPEELDYLDRRSADRAERSRRARESKNEP